MANLLYRSSSTATIPSSTSVKSAPLTNLEVDGNFRSLNEQIAQLSDGTFSYPEGTTLTVDITGSAAQVDNPLAAGSYLTGDNFNGSVATTWAVDATSTNTVSKVVARDANGDFAARIVTVTDLNSTSDASLKENVQDLQHTAIDSVRPVVFNWKETGEKSYGVIAQELEAVFPELVKTDETGIKSVSYIPLISMLVAKVQYLESEIEKLREHK